MISSTVFSGGGLADIGLNAAGHRVAWAIEYHQPAAQIYQLNFGHNPLQDLLKANPADYCTPDYFHLSSPCQSFSAGNINGVEHDGDLALAQKCADFIRWHQPEKLSIKNVPAYKNSKSFELLKAVIICIYPHVTIDTVDFATFGVPQYRRRLILRASFDQMQPLYLSETHSKQPGLFHKSFVGWWEVIKDLIDDFQVSPLTDKERSAIELRKPQPPFLIQRFGDRGNRSLTIREAHEPCWTILASRGGDAKSGNRTRVIDVVTEDGICRSLNLRAVARLMSCPDTYSFPVGAQWHECWQVLGNGVPPLAMKAIAGSF